MNNITEYEHLEVHLVRETGTDYSWQVNTFVGLASAQLKQDLIPVEVALRPEERGNALYRLLFSQEIEGLLARTLQRLESTPHKGLSLRLCFDPLDPFQKNLARLPWEFLFREKDRHFLAHSIRTSIVRYYEAPGTVPHHYPLPQNLQVLLALSEGGNLPTPPNLANEAKDLRGLLNLPENSFEIIRHDGVEDSGTRNLCTRLERRLRSGRFHILHFLGPVEPEKIVDFEGFHDLSSLRMVILDPRRTTPSSSSPELARQLLHKGIPGVLLIPESMPDSTVFHFNKVFYQQLISGAPVESSLSEARLEAHAVSTLSSTPWTPPLLIQRVHEIFTAPKEIGPSLNKKWSVLATLHLFWIGILFLRNRMRVPLLEPLLDGSVAAFCGVVFGLPIFYASLHYALRYAKTVELPRGQGEVSLLRRIALRLPVVFQARIQGRRINETVFQILALLFLVVIPLILQLFLFTRIAKAQVWLHHEPRLISNSWQVNLFHYVPPAEAFCGDKYRLGSMDTRPEEVNIINNVPYVPFWSAWFLLGAELLAFSMVLYLLRSLIL